MKNLKQFFRYIVIAMVFCILLSIPKELMATPYFSLETYDDWSTALSNGTVTPVTSYYDALGSHYGVPGQDFIQSTPSLMALTDEQSGSGDGLLMYWGDNQSDLPQVANWQYNYQLDPDLRGTVLNLTVMPPPGIMSISLTINDLAGGWISWDWNVGPGGLPAGLSSAISIRPDIFAPQGASSFAIAGFNPQFATTIQADELAVGANNWNLFPQVPVVGGAQPWNYWSGVNVKPVPEPATMLLLFSGLLGLVGIKKRRH